jgi:Domain of unknown function (DUF4145)
MGNEKRRISICPHCGNVAPQRLVYEHQTHVKEIDAAGKVTPEELTGYYLALCETCDGPLLYHFEGFTPDDEPPCVPQTEVYDEDEPHPFYVAKRVWPLHGAPAGMPGDLKTTYLEALRIKAVSPQLFAVQIRRALEVMCNDRGAVKGHLEKRLKDLSVKGEIPPKLAEVSDVLRVLGNAGAHDFENKLSPHDANVINRFFRSIVEYVYVAPHSLMRYRSLAKTFGKPVSEAEVDHVEQENTTKEKLLN